MQYDEGTDKEQTQAIRRELAMLKARRVLRTLAVVQDIADALLTLPDLGGELLACISSISGTIHQLSLTAGSIEMPEAGRVQTSRRS